MYESERMRQQATSAEIAALQQALWGNTTQGYLGNLQGFTQLESTRYSSQAQAAIARAQLALQAELARNQMMNNQAMLPWQMTNDYLGTLDRLNTNYGTYHGDTKNWPAQPNPWQTAAGAAAWGFGEWNKAKQWEDFMNPTARKNPNAQGPSTGGNPPPYNPTVPGSGGGL